MAYSSDIKLPIGQEPQIDDNEKIWPDMLDVYNAIHLLSQFTDSLIKNQTSGDSSQKPWEAIPFTRWFYEVVKNDVTVGTIVTPDANAGGYVLGAPNEAVPVNYYQSTYGNGFVGVCLEDAKAGDICKIGMGPAILHVEGIELGDMLFCQQKGVVYNPDLNLPSTEIPSDGKLYRYKYTQMVVVGAAVAKDAALIYPLVDYFSLNTANYVPGSNDSGNSGSGA